VFNRAGYIFDAQTSIELSEFFVYELSVIVGDGRMWDAISAYNIFPDELLDLLGCNGG